MGISRFIKVFLSIVIVGCSLYAADSEGFRDMKWGDSPNIFDKQLIIESSDKASNTVTYIRKNDKLNIGTAKVEKISYRFFDKKLESVLISFKGYNNFSSLKSTLESKYSNPIQPNRYIETYMWDNDITAIFISYKSITDNGYIMMKNDSLHDQLEVYKVNMASQGVKDL